MLAATAVIRRSRKEQGIKMNKPKRTLGGIGLTVATIALLGLGAAPAYAASDIGGLNITGACKAILGSAWSATTNNPSSPWSWYCVKPGSSISLGDQGSMNSVCLSNYGAGAYAVLTYSSAYGWRCYR